MTGEGANIEASGSLHSSVRARRRSLELRFAIVGAVTSVGFLLTVTNASSADWWWLNASSLGIDPGAHLYFNLTMILVGLLFIGVAIPLRTQLLELRVRGLASPRWADAYRLGIAAIPVALICVGMFHIGGSRLPWLIHDVAGFLVPMVVMGMMLTIQLAVPGLRRGFERRSLLIVAAIVGLFVLAVTRVISYSMMEIVSFAICWAWLLRYALQAEMLLDRSARSVPARAIV